MVVDTIPIANHFLTEVIHPNVSDLSGLLLIVVLSDHSVVHYQLISGSVSTGRGKGTNYVPKILFSELHCDQTV